MKTLEFHPLTLADREAVQSVSLYSGRRNCNFTFANLVGWQFWFQTEVCVLPDAVVFRFNIGDERMYMVCSAAGLSDTRIEALLADAGGRLTLMNLDDDQAAQVESGKWHVERESRRNQFDYIYRRVDLALLQGGKLKAKRNHVNRFCAEHPDYEYRPLSPALFDDCRRVAAVWHDGRAHDNPDYGDTVEAERRVMETVFAHWDELGMVGGSIFVDGKMVAFSYGAAVTTDTFDVCVEKADRNVEGAFAVVNQQFAAHLPDSFVFLNREEDMGLPGLRKAKLSYHPEILLSYKDVHIA